MKRRIFPSIFITCVLLYVSAVCCHAQKQPMEVFLHAPEGALKMGDTPVFVGHITNMSNQPLENLVAYVSLVSLKHGSEHPVDLEDWSAQAAFHIARLEPGKSISHNWSLRLIQGGRYGLALTVINPSDGVPVISPLAVFQVEPKTTVIAGRILPVAVGEPLILLAALGLIRLRRSRRRFFAFPIRMTERWL